MTPEQTRLLDLFAALAPSERDSLLAFAEFLHTRASPDGAPRTALASLPPTEHLTLQAIPRPDQETVVAALKRLSLTYPMLDKNKLLTETSGLVTQHIMQRRDAAAVIDELEAIFLSNYRAWLNEAGQG